MRSLVCVYSLNMMFLFAECYKKSGDYICVHGDRWRGGGGGCLSKDHFAPNKGKPRSVNMEDE